MDPLSLIASVVAIASAAAQIGKAISSIRAIAKIPSRIYALKNDVADLEVVLHQLGSSLEKKPLSRDIEYGALKQLLARAKDHLAKLASALQRVANACLGPNKSASIVRQTAVWWKEKSFFQTIQTNIRTVKADLVLLLGASNSHDLQHIMLELRQVTTLTTVSSQVQDNNSKYIAQRIDENHHALNAHLTEQHQDLSTRLDTMAQLMLNEKPTEKDSPGNSPNTSEGEEGQAMQSSIETFRVLMSHRTPCKNWCPCACHTKKKMQAAVPRIMESVLGRLFVDYSGLPVLSKPCDFRACKDQQRPSVTMEYWFPWWLVAKNLKLFLQVLPSAGPQLQLSMTRRVSDTSPAISYAMKGDIDGLKYLFSQGLASPRDVSDSRGYTLMRWALYGGMHQYETVKFLLDQGASVDEISYENVWDFLFRGKCNQKEKDGLRCITEGGEGDWVEEQNFPLVHRIIFGLSSKPLAVELEENPHTVHATDAQGRTALDWATARAQLDDIRLLLAHGADPNTMDITGRTTVLHAVDSHQDDALRLVLEAGGNPNPAMPKGVFRSSPLTAAGFGGLKEMLKMLLQFGAEPNACNPEGMTALHSVARTQNIDCALVLLEFGADLNAVSRNGQTPLTTAITHNNHAVLKLFVDRCYEYITAARLKGPQILTTIAEHADLETMITLASSNPLRIAYNVTPEGLAAGQEVLKKRRDYNERLAMAFDELVSIAQEVESGEGSVIDSLVESGLYFSAKSSLHSELEDAVADLNTAGAELAEAGLTDLISVEVGSS